VSQDNTCDHVCEAPPDNDAEALGVCCLEVKFGSTVESDPPPRRSTTSAYVVVRIVL
jgi:hypothetical protein